MPYQKCVDSTVVVIFILLMVMRENVITKISRQLGSGGTLSIPNFAEDNPVSAIFLTKVTVPVHVTLWVNKGEESLLQIYHNKILWFPPNI